MISKASGMFGALPDDPEMVVKINAGVQVGAGALLAIGRLPRLSAAVLAGSLVPTTLAGHPFWEESDPAKRAQQQIQFVKNASLLGGLILAAFDTDGAPSLGWRARRTVARTAKVASAASSVGSTVGRGRDLASAASDTLGSTVGRGRDLASAASDTLGSTVGRSRDLVSAASDTLGSTVGRSRDLASAASDTLGSTVGRSRDLASAASDTLGSTVGGGLDRVGAS